MTMPEVSESRTRLDRMIDVHVLERVPPNSAFAETLLAEALRHLATAASTTESDPGAAYAIMYDAARKALTALLIHVGIRVTSRGGHRACYEAALIVLGNDERKSIRAFDRMRERRNQVEYPSEDRPNATSEEVASDLGHSRAIVEFVSAWIARKPSEAVGN